MQSPVLDAAVLDREDASSLGLPECGRVPSTRRRSAGSEQRVQRSGFSARSSIQAPATKRVFGITGYWLLATCGVRAEHLDDPRTIALCAR